MHYAGKLFKTALVLVASTLSFAVSAAPQVGDEAPNFSLPGSDGNTHTLADMRGQYVVVAFFPKAFTSG
jgi:peroxiredoxin Q/BCP